MIYLEKIWHYLLILLTIFVWTVLFKLKFKITFEVILLFISFISLYVLYVKIKEFKIKILSVAIYLLIYVSLIHILVKLTINLPQYISKIISMVFSLGIIILVISIYKIIKNYEKREKMIKHLCFHDYMTDLYNRRYFENEIERLNNSRKLPISVVIADIDNLKLTNDTYGHKTGDKVIKYVAQAINSVIREADIVARIGGDEFAIILPETGAKVATKVCNRIKEKFVKQYIDDLVAQDIVGISLGSATKYNKETDLEKVVAKADEKMYENKMEGKNC